MTSAPPIAPIPSARPTPPKDRFALSSFVFLRVLAVVHVIAFLSFWVQMEGLIGMDGIMPAPGASHGSNTPLHLLCALGIAAGTLLLAGVAPAFCLLTLWAAYLTLMGSAPLFLGYQWDALLLETTLLAAFLVPWSLSPGWRLAEAPRVARWLLRWLLFRLMFLSGVVKLTSGDPTWWHLAALRFHFETQPLPTGIAWLAHQLPDGVLRAACAAMFATELVVPFLLWFPRPVRHVATLLTLALQVGIAVTGNYAFFNYLTIALCLLCLDDAWWLRVLSPALRRGWAFYAGSWRAPREASVPRTRGRRRAAGYETADHGNQWAVGTAAAVVLYTTVLALPVFGRDWPGWFRWVVADVAPFSSFNNYGLFAVMTTTRPELIIEGSNDESTWLAYELPHKPGALDARPTFVAPHQPRLDWQLWFAALGQPMENEWVDSLCDHLLRGTPAVTRLFRRNPFPQSPPRYVRILRYRYRFASAAERRQTGHWWRRELLDVYVPSTRLQASGHGTLPRSEPPRMARNDAGFSL